MGSSKLLKACKIDSISYASHAIHFGVQLLGVHIIQSKDIGKRVDINNYINSKHSKVVIVTKVKSIALLKKISKIYSPYGIQLHFPVKINYLLLIKNTLPNLKIFSVITDELNWSQNKSIIEYSDFVIYDSSYIGGTGKQNSYKQLRYIPRNQKNKIILSGGVNFKKVKQLIDSDVGGFDIQSYFRRNDQILYMRIEKVVNLLNNR